MQEKRKYIRIKPAKTMKVKFKVIRADKKFKRALSKSRVLPRNISGGGMFIELPYMRPDIIKDLLSGKNKVALELKIPGRAPKVKILGKAIWLDKSHKEGYKGHGIGIEFEDIKEEDRERLLQYMLELILQ